MEEEIAKEIVKEIKQSIKESLSTLEGADSESYQRFYQYLRNYQEEIAKVSGLPLRVVEKIIALIDKRKVLPIAKKLLEENVQYDATSNTDSFDSRERDLSKLREKEGEDLEEEEELDQEDALEEDASLDTLAKLSAKRQKKDAKEILKRLLVCIVAARMDPRRRAGESGESNARYAKIYGREGQISLKELVQAGVVSSAVMARLNAQGISGNASLSVSRVQSFVVAQFKSIVDLIKGKGFDEVSTRIPGKSEGFLSLSKVNNSLGIFGGNATAAASTNVSAGSTPFVQRGSGNERGR